MPALRSAISGSSDPFFDELSEAPRILYLEALGARAGEQLVQHDRKTVDVGFDRTSGLLACSGAR